MDVMTMRPQITEDCATWDSFEDYCLYCLKRIYPENRHAVLRSIKEGAFACTECFHEFASEQAALARIIMKLFFIDSGLEIKEDMADFDLEPPPAKRQNWFYLSGHSELFLSVPDCIRIAAEIMGCMLVATREGMHEGPGC